MYMMLVQLRARKASEQNTKHLNPAVRIKKSGTAHNAKRSRKRGGALTKITGEPNPLIKIATVDELRMRSTVTVELLLMVSAMKAGAMSEVTSACFFQISRDMAHGSSTMTTIMCSSPKSRGAGVHMFEVIGSGQKNLVGIGLRMSPLRGPRTTTAVGDMIPQSVGFGCREMSGLLPGSLGAEVADTLAGRQWGRAVEAMRSASKTIMNLLS